MIYIQALAIVGGRKNNNNERTNKGKRQYIVWILKDQIIYYIKE